MDIKKTLVPAVIVAAILVAIAFWLGKTKANTAPRNPAVPNPLTQSSEPAQTTDIAPVDPAVDRIKGDAAAPVTIVTYSDIHCPYCRMFHPVVSELVENNPGKVRFVFRHMPIDSLHPLARKAAQAAECAGDQEKFWEYLDRAYAVEDPSKDLSIEGLRLLAIKLELDQPKFEACLDSGEKDSKVNSDSEDSAKNGIDGTPTSVIFGPEGTRPQLLIGSRSIETIQQIVDALMASPT